MQRVRAGLTGLAAIFLLVLIAAAGLKPARPAAAPATSQNETLAVLGVAPGSNGDGERKRTVQQMPKPKPAKPVIS